MRIGDVVRTGDNRLGRVVKSNGEYFHYLWILNDAGNHWSMDKFHINEIVPASDHDVMAYKEMARTFNQKHLASPR